MQTAILYDCEFLAIEGCMRRYWNGPYDPDPVVVQIGAVKLGLEGEFPLLGEERLFVRPVDRHGNRYPIDPFLTNLTGITDADIDSKGMSLTDAMARLDVFADGATLWAWGKDEINTLAISCFVEGIPCPVPASRFDNICKLVLRAGMPYADVQKTASSRLAAYFGVARDGLRAHDALDDARSVTDAVRHLLQTGRLTAADFAPDAGLPPMA